MLSFYRIFVHFKETKREKTTSSLFRNIVFSLCSVLLHFYIIFRQTLHFSYISSSTISLLHPRASAHSHGRSLPVFPESGQSSSPLWKAGTTTSFFSPGAREILVKAFSSLILATTPPERFRTYRHGTEVPAMAPVFSTVNETAAPFSSFVHGNIAARQTSCRIFPHRTYAAAGSSYRSMPERRRYGNCSTPESDRRGAAWIPGDGRTDSLVP